MGGSSPLAIATQNLAKVLDAVVCRFLTKLELTGDFLHLHIETLQLCANMKDRKSVV